MISYIVVLYGWVTRDVYDDTHL